jgi:hypothetical protein
LKASLILKQGMRLMITKLKLEQANVALFSSEVNKEPMNFDEAWNCSNKVYQRK